MRPGSPENIKNSEEMIMPNDATFELMAELQNQQRAAVSLMVPPTYNIDDMDPRACMIDLIFSGCYCLCSSKAIDPKRPGMIYIDGEPTEAPLIPKLMPMFGQIIGIRARRYLLDYGRDYEIRYAGAYDTEGLEIPEFCFILKTLSRKNPGERYPEHDEIVLRAARECAVLLKNENHTLPLGENAAVNVFGAAAVVFRSGCLGAGKINPRYCIRVREGIEKYTSLRLNEELYGFYTQEKNVLPSEEMIGWAKGLNDTAVIFLSRGSSEAHDVLPEKGGYYLTDEERELVKGVSEKFSKTVAVLNVAHPIETGWIEEYGIDAVLVTGLSGMMGGRALAEILEGKVSPSGKLPTTWAKDYWDYPSARNFLTMKDVREKYAGQDIKYLATVYEEGLYVGYRYFDTFGVKPAYRFGHGLSYTDFEKKVISASPDSVKVSVRNIGERAGNEVVQLYAGLPDGKLEQPARRLVAFAKTKELNPGEAETVILPVSESRLKSYDEERAEWIIEAGRVSYYLDNMDDKPVYEYENTEQILCMAVKNRVRCPIRIMELSKKNPDSYPQGKLTQGFTEDQLPYMAERDYSFSGREMDKTADHVIPFEEVVKDSRLVEAFVAQMSDYELARLSVGGRTGWGMEDKGFAGMLYDGETLSKYRIPEYYFADGNNGVNLFEPNIGFPTSASMAATWNEELSHQEGVSIATEAKDMGIHCLLAPAMNLHRNILCGRNSEYFSEDPFLAGRMAGQESRGFEDIGIASCLKHFFANNAETMRNLNHSIMSERTARELYIAAFEAAFEVNMPDTVMTGYNAANGAYCADDPELLQGILREELGFTGYVMTDWNGYGNLGMDRLAAAGVGWIAPGSLDDTFVTPIVEALASGKLSRARLQNNLAGLIKVIIKYRKELEGLQ